MSFAAALTEFYLPMLSLGDLVRALGMLAVLAGLLMFFRPLLNGMRRALVLAVRARLARKCASARLGAVPGQRA